MALDVKTGHFSKNTGGAPVDDAITGVGFLPKAMMFWGNPRITANEANAEGDIAYSFGVTDGTDDACLGMSSDDGNATGNGFDTVRNDAVWVTVTDNATTVDARASLKSFDADGFTVTWDVNDAVASVVHYMAWGGADLTDVDVANFTSSTTASPTTQNVATSIDTADFVIMGMTQFSTTVNSVASFSSFSIGCASSTTARWVVNSKIRHGTGNSNVAQQFKTDEIASTLGSSATLVQEGDFAGFTASGFDITWTTNFHGSPKQCFFLTMKGGQWEVGDDAAPTSTGNKAYTTAFQPEGVFVAGMKRTTVGAGFEDIVLTCGAANSTTTEEESGFYSDNGQATQENGGMGSITLLYTIIDPSVVSTTVLN